MRILVVGSGGREHALGWALAQSDTALCFAPGNAGTAALGRNVAIGAADIPALAAFVRQESMDLTVVGPEIPLVAGIADAFAAARLPVMGPTAAASEIEGSKAFAKSFMARRGIPTADFRVFTADTYDAARQYVQDQGAPIVIKASGLAAGKGAIVCTTEEEALAALERTLQARDFGDAGAEVVVEAYMEGEEASVFAFTDGDDYVCLSPAQDHKRIGEHDTGPNTGGMGAYAPAPVVDAALLQRVRADIIEPTLEGLASEGRLYRGCLYVGLMVTGDGPKVVEFNCRLGDPEAQVVLPLLDVDAAELMLAVTDGRLGRLRVDLASDAALCVVLASRGYPGPYTRGYAISGLEAASEEALVFHAGTAHNDKGEAVTAGGRVLGVTGRGPTLEAALAKAYAAANCITFEGAVMRRDIGQKGLERMKL